MKQYRAKSKVINYLGTIFIRERIQVKGKWFWKTLDIRDFGPYPSCLAAHLAIENRGGAIINF